MGTEVGRIDGCLRNQIEGVKEGKSDKVIEKSRTQSRLRTGKNCWGSDSKRRKRKLRGGGGIGAGKGDIVGGGNCDRGKVHGISSLGRWSKDRIASKRMPRRWGF